MAVEASISLNLHSSMGLFPFPHYSGCDRNSPKKQYKSMNVYSYRKGYPRKVAKSCKHIPFVSRSSLKQKARFMPPISISTDEKRLLNPIKPPKCMVLRAILGKARKWLCLPETMGV